MNKTFMVLEEKLGWFEKQMGKLVKRAAKLKVQPVSYTVGAAQDFPVQMIRHGYSPEAAELVGPSAYYTVVIRKFPVTIEGKAPKFAGWTLAAVLQHLEGGEVIIRSIVEEDVPAKYREAKSDCEHCNSYRRRNDTYLVRSEAGVYKQVGSSCIRDFLGHESPESIAAEAEMLACALGLGEMGEEGSGFGGGVDRTSILTFLAYTNAAIRSAGWISRTNARKRVDEGDYVTATADLVMAMLFPRSPEMRAEAALFTKNMDAKDDAAAEVALDWALNLEDGSDLNDYLHNIRAIARSGSVELRTAGYAGSIIGAYERAVGAAKERAERPVSNHVGVVGERLTVKVLVQDVRHIEGAYGAVHLYMMTDEVGNDLKWFASNEDLDKGETYTLVGTVKKHDEYKGRKNTILSRCKLHVEKPKKDKANKSIAAGVVAFFQGVMEPYLVAQALVKFVELLVQAFETYHEHVGYGIKMFFSDAVYSEQKKLNAIGNGINYFMEGAAKWPNTVSSLLGNSVACFFVWAMLGSSNMEFSYMGVKYRTYFNRYKTFEGVNLESRFY